MRPSRPIALRHIALWHRLRPTRHPLLHWAVALALALATGALVAGLVSSAEAERDRYGDQRAVLVATRDLSAGHALEPGDAEVRRLPAALVPAGAVDEAPPGTTLAVPVFAGDVLAQAKLAPAGLSEVAALLPPGTRGLAIPVDAGHLTPSRGDLVDVLATFGPDNTGHDGEPTFSVADGALVIDVGDDAVTVAVTEAQAPRVAFAVTQGVVTLALSGLR